MDDAYWLGQGGTVSGVWSAVVRASQGVSRQDLSQRAALAKHSADERVLHLLLSHQEAPQSASWGSSWLSGAATTSRLRDLQEILRLSELYFTILSI